MQRGLLGGHGGGTSRLPPCSRSAQGPGEARAGTPHQLQGAITISGRSRESERPCGPAFPSRSPAADLCLLQPFALSAAGGFGAMSRDSSHCNHPNPAGRSRDLRETPRDPGSFVQGQSHPLPPWPFQTRTANPGDSAAVVQRDGAGDGGAAGTQRDQLRLRAGLHWGPGSGVCGQRRGRAESTAGSSGAGGSPCLLSWTDGQSCPSCTGICEPQAQG